MKIIEFTNNNKISAVIIVIAIVIFGYAQTLDRFATWDLAAKVGYYPPMDIYDGHFLGLIAPNFVHLDFLHIFFNLYWIVQFGPIIEKWLTWWQNVLFVLACGFLCATVEMNVSGSVGIGLSGVVYGYFGLLLTKTNEADQSVLQPNTKKLLIAWLFICILLDIAGVLSIANGAHFAGIIFGFLISQSVKKARFKVICQSITAGILAIAVLSIAYNPFDPSWHWHKANEAIAQEDWDTSLLHLKQVRAMNPNDLEAEQKIHEINKYKAYISQQKP